MAVSTTKRLQRHALSAALTSALFMTATAVMAQETAPAPEDNQATELDKVVVTGSLIPQTTLETFKPVITISAEDIKNRGFNNVQEALAQRRVGFEDARELGGDRGDVAVVHAAGRHALVGRVDQDGRWMTTRRPCLDLDPVEGPGLGDRRSEHLLRGTLHILTVACGRHCAVAGLHLPGGHCLHLGTGELCLLRRPSQRDE